MGRGDCEHCGKHIADWPESWGVDVTLYCPRCFGLIPRPEVENPHHIGEQNQYMTEDKEVEKP